jgi:hypothetical protein
MINGRLHPGESSLNPDNPSEELWLHGDPLAGRLK